jgi:hypothetical protein
MASFLAALSVQAVSALEGVGGLGVGTLGTGSPPSAVMIGRPLASGAVRLSFPWVILACGNRTTAANRTIAQSWKGVFIERIEFSLRN